MERSNSYLVKCWHCMAEYNVMEAPFCNHFKHSKICPFCLNCSCQAPKDYQDFFWENIPKELLEEKLIWENQASFKLGEILTRRGKISKSQLMEAMEKQRILKKRLGEIMVMMDLLTPDELELYLIDQKNMEEIDLADFRLNRLLLERIGVDFCTINRVIPLESLRFNDQEILRLAISPGVDLNHLKMKERIKDFTLIFYLAKPDLIDHLLKHMVGDVDPPEVLVLEEDDKKK